MSEISLTFSNLDADTATRLIAVAQGAGVSPVGAPANPPQPAAAPPQPQQAASAPGMAPPAPPPAQVPPQPANAPSPSNGAANGQVTQQDALAAMSAYAQTFKAAGVKAVFDKFGLQANITTVPPERLPAIVSVFRAMTPPDQVVAG